MPRAIKKSNIYQEKLLKLIPSEIVAAYLALQGIVPEEHSKWGLLFISIILLILTPFYLKKFQNVTHWLQLTITTLSFIIWIYTLGGPFELWGLYIPWIGSIVMVIWTLIVPLLIEMET